MNIAAVGDDRLAPDRDAISRFFRETVSEAIHLAWIIPDGGRAACGGQWFGRNVEDAAAWATLHNADGRNVYWTVNIVRAELHKKPAKTDITHARFVHVDIDPPKDGGMFDRDGILVKLDPLEPTFVIDSGGGLQGFWRLDGLSKDLTRIEEINQQVRDLFNADACQNIDRLMRIPGTINWPDERKKARGRVPALASIVQADTGEAVGAERLSAMFAAVRSSEDESGTPARSVSEELGITRRCQPLHRLLTATDPNRRSEEVLRAAGEMVRRGFDDATITRILLDPQLPISGHCLEQPDPTRAAKRAISRVRQESQGQPSRSGVEPGHVCETAELRPVDLWARYEAPDLPLGLLPGPIERFAVRHGQVMGADFAGLAMAALAVCAATISDAIAVQVKRNDPNWRESARLWVGLVGAPSTKKSPIMSAALRPLRSIDGALMQGYLKRLAEHESLSASERKCSPRPRQERRIIADTTVEAAQEVLKDSPRGVLSSQDELSGWFGAMDKYAPGKGAMADRGFWLQAFNGGQYSINRIARGASFIPNCSVSLLGGIQPEPLRAIASDAHDDGLIQRLLPVILRPGDIGRDMPSGGAVADYEDLIARLDRLAPPRRVRIPSLTEAERPQPLRFSDGARGIRERLEAEHLTLVRALEVISPKLAAHFGKYDGLFARLCVLWHCIEHADATDLPVEITEGVAARVAAFMAQFLRPSAIAFYAGLLGLSDGHEDLLALASFIVAKGLTEVKARDAQRSTQSFRHMTADEFRRLCEKLEAFSWLDRKDPGPNSATPRWMVNPAVHQLFSERARLETERRKAAREALRHALSA